jgi:predicted Zn-dependent protease with MMP-like domain
MYTIDEVSEILDDIVDEIPEDLFKDLNGGIILLEECKPHPDNIGPMYILGEYHYSRGMGRYICIYYGSFMRLFSYYSKDKLRERLRETLLHEFTHHLESLAGEKGLEIQDAIKLEKYRRLYKKP